MKVHIHIKLYATLSRFTPPFPDAYPVEKGSTVKLLLKQLKIPEKNAKLIFVNSVKGNPDSILQGGESVGVFPPVGGG